ncbi:MAG: hypothetical protein IKG69_09450 [Atopobiaceae bacterium]|nr:hypothetical protein [Atopobiaceae bacterium]
MTSVASPRDRGGWWTTLLRGYVIVVLLLAAVWAFSVMGPMSSALEESQQNGLVAVAQTASVALETSELPAETVIDRIAADDNLRLTLVSETGEVLAESTDAGMTNHASRPEVIAALAGEVGYDRRLSETDGIEYLYAAIPCEYEGSTCVLRVSMPVSQAHEDLSRLRWTSIVLLVASTVLAAGAAWLMARRAAVPVDRLERVRTDFVANASHELKTPVAGIRLLSESIEATSEDGDLEATRAFSGRLSKEVARLQSLVTDLMDLSRLEDEFRSPNAAATCDLAGIVATAVESRLPNVREHGLTLELDESHWEAGGRARISAADATLVVDNLIDNAIAYTEEGMVSVLLATEGHDAVLRVADTGIGIPARDQERIFERFYRVDKARSREEGGTGLGLALVRHAVDRAGGSISVESELDVGSTFTVSLPLA